MKYTRIVNPLKPALVGPVLILMLVLTSSLAFAQAGARVYPQTVSNADGLVVVDVVAENVTDLYGAEFRLKYDPAVLAVQDLNPEQEGIQIEAGNFLPADKGFVVANEVQETDGLVLFAITLLNPAPPVNGAGPLARVTFKRLQETPATVTVEHAKLVAINLQTIPSQTGSLSLEAAAQPAEPAAAASAPPAPAPTGAEPSAPRGEFPWWLAAAVIMVLGILALGGFIIMDGLKSAAARRQNTPAGRPPAYGSGTRPSAFKNHMSK